MSDEVQDIASTGELLEHGELRHRYGPRVHLLSDPYHLALLATLGHADTVQPRVSQLVTTLYRDLVAAVVAREFPTSSQAIDTRMKATTPRGVWRGQAVERDTQVVCVDIARAGMLPAQVCFDALNQVLDPSGVRQDHLVMNRVTDDEGQVVGVRLFGEKTGGNVDGRILLFPDPMGATGGSLVKAMDFYTGRAGGTPRRIVAMNLIVTPEFIRRVTSAHPEAVVYAFRVDRGTSPAEVLRSEPGTHPELETGLDDVQYIVPGAGGLGEVINNVYV